MSTVLAVALLGGVAAAVYFGRQSDDGENNTPGLTELRGVIGSEKGPLFNDPEFARLLAKHGLKVTADPAGSRTIAGMDLAGKDFVFPSSLPAAEKIRIEKKIQRSWSPFYSPMAVATFKPVADVLEAQKLVTEAPGGYRVLDMAAFIPAFQNGLRWDRMPGNTIYPARQTVAVTTTTPRDSNSAAMYAAVLSFMINGQKVVQNDAELGAVKDRVAALFKDQGYQESSTEGPWESYLANGLNFKPLVWVYEAQYIGRQVRSGGVRPNSEPASELIYPAPTVLSKHTLLPLSDGGDKLGRLLTEDPELQRLASRHGFRTAAFDSVMKEANLMVPSTVPDNINPPTFDIQETMLDEIAKTAGGGR